MSVNFRAFVLYEALSPELKTDRDGVQTAMERVYEYPEQASGCDSDCALFGFGDCVNQHLVHRKNLSEHEWGTTGKMMAFGLFVGGPIFTGWYRVLDRVVGPRVSPGKAAFAKVAIDQAFMAPSFIGLFFVCMGLMDGKDSKTIMEEMRKEYLPVLRNNYTLWPAAQLFNFYFVPLNFRVAFVQCVAIAWNSYLASVNMKLNTSQISPSISSTTPLEKSD
eukprot:Nk52_evm78s207 gene=Nk52_evmTU78s207